MKGLSRAALSRVAFCIHTFMTPTADWQIDARQVLYIRSSASFTSSSSTDADDVAQSSSGRRRLLSSPIVLLLKQEEDHHVPKAAAATTAGLGSVVIDTIKWLTVAACLTRYFLNPSALLLLQEQFNSLASNVGGGNQFLSVVDYPSRQHSQFRLMVAGYITARVFLSSLQPQFSLQPTPNIQF